MPKRNFKVPHSFQSIILIPTTCYPFVQIATAASMGIICMAAQYAQHSTLFCHVKSTLQSLQDSVGLMMNCGNSPTMSLLHIISFSF